MKMFSLCGGGLLLFAAAAVAQPPSAPSLVDVIKSPEKYEGQTLTLEPVLLSGDFTKGEVRYRLTLKTPAGKLVDNGSHPEGISFVTAFTYGDKVKVQLSEGRFQTVRLTCTIRGFKAAKAKDRWLAVVSKIELIKENEPGEKIAKGKGAAEQKKGKAGNGAHEIVVAEGVGITHSDALKDALRNAVRQVVGALVDAETLVKNDDLISDRVLTLSDGLVKKCEEISKKEEKGLFRVKIRATVEKTELVAKLKAANVTTKDVDGKGLFAEVVTGLDKEKDAKALLTKLLREYRTSIVRAEVVGKPRPTKKGETETIIEYEIKLSADPERYDALCKKLLPVLRRAAFAKGTERSETTAEVINYPWNQIPGFAATSSRILNQKGGLFQLGFRLQQSRKKADNSDEMLIFLCTQRTKLADRLTWEWFYVPNTTDESIIQVHVSVVDGPDHEITSNDIRLPSDFMPGYRRQQNILVLSPFVLDDCLSANIVGKLTSRVPTPDLLRIKAIRCKVEVNDGAK